MDKKQKVKRIFDSISYRYDFLNHFLSAGIDFYWRRKSLKLTGVGKETRLLDLACGTGDFAIAARKKGVQDITGADLSFNMLRLFNDKSDWSKGNIVQTIAENLPFSDNAFTNITVAFGVRNFYDIPKAFGEFHRVLESKGKATILEFRLPEKSLLKTSYMFYFKHILPVIGRIFSRDKEAYTYLPESVQEFDKEIDLKAILESQGFTKVSVKSLTFGIVQVVIAEK